MLVKQMPPLLPSPQRKTLKSEGMEKNTENAGAPADESVPRDRTVGIHIHRAQPRRQPGCHQPLSVQTVGDNRVMGKAEPRNSPASPTRQLRDVARQLLRTV